MKELQIFLFLLKMSYDCKTNDIEKLYTRDDGTSRHRGRQAAQEDFHPLIGLISVSRLSRKIRRSESQPSPFEADESFVEIASHGD